MHEGKDTWHHLYEMWMNILNCYALFRNDNYHLMTRYRGLYKEIKHLEDNIYGLYIHHRLRVMNNVGKEKKENNKASDFRRKEDIKEQLNECQVLEGRYGQDYTDRHR